MSMPSFSEFFSALHPDQAPFPWQVRLAEVVLETGWPALLDLPTGVGKTTALEVALYCLAMRPDRLPRRTLLVVDRRVVVDQGAEQARATLASMMAAKSGPLKAVADALRALWSAKPDEPPFAVAVMRGGMPRDNDWARRPDMPVLGVSTVDQVGSRLLFRGYGIGAKSASIHAGLMGTDTLILLDEVHLSEPFAETLDAIRSFKNSSVGIPDRFQVVRMSATPGTSSMTTFQLNANDREHPVLQRRLESSKQARLHVVKVTGEDEANKRALLAAQAVKEALALQKAGAVVVGVVVNRVDTARLAVQLLEDHRKTTSALLVTGRMRPIDRDRVVREVLVPSAGARRQRAGAKPLIVVATQCIEAGADLDFDALVSECASLDALRQRFGRVDRRGELGTSTSVILCRSDQTTDDDDPVYGTALSATWKWLESQAKGSVVDFGISALMPPDEDERQPLLAPRSSAPVLLPAHLDAWAQTSPRPAVDPDIALWLHGPQRAAADVQVIWRNGITLGTSEAERDANVARLGVCRPSSLEAITLPIAVVRRWLLQQPSFQMADTVANIVDEDEWRTKRNSSDDVVAWRWDGDDSELIKAQELRVGDVIVVDSNLGGIAADSFDPDGKSPVTDLGDLAQLRGRGRASLRLAPGFLKAWGLAPDVLKDMPKPVEDEAPADLQERLADWVASFPLERPTDSQCSVPEWNALRNALNGSRRRARVIDDIIVVEAQLKKADLREPEFADAVTEDDRSSFLDVAVTLKTHSTDVRDFAMAFTKQLGMDPALAADVVQAAWLHDVGKADPRFQRWLVGGSEIAAAGLSELLAKSAVPSGSPAERKKSRRRAGYPDGYRHELLSLAMIEGSDALAKAHDRDLVLHLVASHHGWCRPFPPAIDNPDSMQVALKHNGDEFVGDTRHRLSRLDSGVSERFWALTDRYGWWGLAWLEAMVRLADHRASEKETGGAA